MRRTSATKRWQASRAASLGSTREASSDSHAARASSAAPCQTCSRHSHQQPCKLIIFHECHSQHNLVQHDQGHDENATPSGLLV